MIIPLEQISKEHLSSEDYVIFGGTFDPPHIGHIQDIRYLAQLFCLVIVAPAQTNPWKSNLPPPTPLNLRYEMIKIALASEQIQTVNDHNQDGIYVLNRPYIYAAELVSFFRADRTGTLYWAVGEDIADTVCRWKDWNQLDVPVISLPIVYDMHSSDVRSAQKQIHPALSEFARLHKLYKV